MNILYVGRGTEEKRVHLVGRIAALCSRKGLPVNIRLVGDVAGAVAEADRPFCQVLGEVADRDALAAMYDEAHLLLLTSSREGFPLVIMEAMAHGVVPLTTDVGGISAHVRDGVNGWLVPGAAPEDEIVSAMGALIERACADRSLLGCMARAAHDHAREHFGGEKFCAAYRALLLGP